MLFKVPAGIELNIKNKMFEEINWQIKLIRREMLPMVERNFI